MCFSKTSEPVFMKKAVGILYLIFAILLIVGCSANGTAEGTGAEAEETVDESEQAIRAVIEKEFNGPDEKYKELLDTAMKAQISDKYMDDYEAYLESPEYQALMSYVEETYASYFTENGYDTFINTSAFMYAGFDSDYELNTSAIDIAQSENEKTLYNFTFQVEYKDENGESNQFDFEGSAIAPEEGKIGKIEYLDGYEDGLLEELRSNE
ncbi:major membrane immunogen (membrane-anchored lipoprotein) [Planomicrobium stackebrandtii]|uniref:Major membrane immunogen (Membrane-anchored lipoprotein) n=1 Tax=Planomicrobium stackebrandtii TaxID=253160 RepID=A0ABU0GVQ1_9BACL|nr:hypothetical protein [Planomicrobium stackebrandtii]MDQ0429449.1 major membrane immunogen (membrane-anchored lipoprotein) [Planomicrobium stackebrandtii]